LYVLGARLGERLCNLPGQAKMDRFFQRLLAKVRRKRG